MSDPALDAFRRVETAEVERLALAALAHGTRAERIGALCMLARVALREDDLERAAARAAEAADLAAGAEPLAMQEPLHLLAAVARLQGDLGTARLRYLESIELNTALGMLGPVAVEQRNLAHVELHLGRVEEAERRFAAARTLRRSLGSALDPAAELLDEAVVAARRGERATAAQLLVRLRDGLRSSDRVPDPDEVREIEALQRLLDAQ